MKMATNSYEAKYLRLAGMPKMEALRRECSCKGRMVHNLCNSRGWFSLPEAERLGALVHVLFGIYPGHEGIVLEYGSYPSLEAKLTEVLTLMVANDPSED